MSAPLLHVSVQPNRGSHDDAAYSAAVALDDVAGWFIDDGWTEEDFVDRCIESYQRVKEDAE